MEAPADRRTSSPDDGMRGMARPNRLNDLSPKAWIKFQKSWFIHNPPPREHGPAHVHVVKDDAEVVIMREPH